MALMLHYCTCIRRVICLRATALWYRYMYVCICQHAPVHVILSHITVKGQLFLWNCHKPMGQPNTHMIKAHQNVYIARTPTYLHSSKPTESMLPTPMNWPLWVWSDSGRRTNAAAAVSSAPSNSPLSPRTAGTGTTPGESCEKQLATPLRNTLRSQKYIKPDYTNVYASKTMYIEIYAL